MYMNRNRFLLSMWIIHALPSMILTMFVRVSEVMATAVAAANPAVFQSVTTWAEYLPVIALAVVKHAADPATRIVKKPPITL